MEGGPGDAKRGFRKEAMTKGNGKPFVLPLVADLKSSFQWLEKEGGLGEVALPKVPRVGKTTGTKLEASSTIHLPRRASRRAAVPERDTLKPRARGAPVPGRGPWALTASLRDGCARAGRAGDAVGVGVSRNHATTAAPPDRHSTKLKGQEEGAGLAGFGCTP